MLSADDGCNKRRVDNSEKSQVSGWMGSSENGKAVCYRAPLNPSISTSTADKASVAADSLRITGVGKSSTLTKSATGV
jgi:hypothetical protein